MKSIKKRRRIEVGALCLLILYCLYIPFHYSGGLLRINESLNIKEIIQIEIMEKLLLPILIGSTIIVGLLITAPKSWGRKRKVDAVVLSLFGVALSCYSVCCIYATYNVELINFEMDCTQEMLITIIDEIKKYFYLLLLIGIIFILMEIYYLFRYKDICKNKERESDIFLTQYGLAEKIKFSNANNYIIMKFLFILYVAKIFYEVSLHLSIENPMWLLTKLGSIFLFLGCSLKISAEYYVNFSRIDSQ